MGAGQLEQGEIVDTGQWALRDAKDLWYIKAATIDNSTVIYFCLFVFVVVFILGSQSYSLYYFSRLISIYLFCFLPALPSC